MIALQGELSLASNKADIGKVFDVPRGGRGKAQQGADGRPHEPE